MFRNINILDVTYYYINQITSIYMFRGGARILVGGGNIGQNFIHELLSSPLLQWRRQNFGSGGHSAKLYSSKTFEKFEKFIKNLHKNLKKFSKFLKNNI